MGKVVFNMTMSLDGFVAGPNDSPENGLGDGGDRLFDWYFRGVRLFDNLGSEPIELAYIKAIEAPGVTHLRFRVVK